MSSYVSRAHIPYVVKKKVFDVVGYEPWGAQEAFHQSNALHRILAAGNQSGKTFAAAREILVQLLIPIFDTTLNGARGRRGWVVVPQYSLADPIAHQVLGLLDQLDHHRATKRTALSEGEYYYSPKDHVLTFWNGAMLWIKSTDTPASLHAQPLDYIVIDEAGLIPFDIYQINLMPRLTVTGGWIAAIGTFEDTEVGRWFADFYRIGQTDNGRSIESFTHPTVGSPYVAEEWLEQQRDNYDPDLFAARFLAQPTVGKRLMVRNFSFAEHVDRQFTEFDRRLPVYLGVDPGGTYAVAVMQIKYDEEIGEDVVCLFDEIYDTQGGPTPEVIRKARDRIWWPNVGLGDMRGAIDIANKESGDIWTNEGCPLRRQVRVNPEAGADLLCTFLHQGKFKVHPRCKQFLNEVVRYARTRRSMGKDYAAAPPSDDYNHLVKGITYFLVTKFGWSGRRKRKEFIPGPIMWPIGT